MDKTVSKGEIFVMDNDAATRATLSLVLQQEGHDVICFADSASLLLSARARNPACIFLEIAAPEKSGLDILQRLRAEDCCIPIFAISGQADIPTAVDAIRNGAFDFIQKPLLRSEIVPLVRQAIGTRRSTNAM